MNKRVETRVDGFIIVNRGWDALTQLQMGMSSFGRTPAEAWRRHVGHEKATSQDFPIYVQRWSDKGYGPIAVTASPARAHKEQAR